MIESLQLPQRMAVISASLFQSKTTLRPGFALSVSCRFARDSWPRRQEPTASEAPIALVRAIAEPHVARRVRRSDSLEESEAVGPPPRTFATPQGWLLLCAWP